jgi:hypothetical protein
VGGRTTPGEFWGWSATTTIKCFFFNLRFRKKKKIMWGVSNFDSIPIPHTEQGLRLINKKKSIDNNRNYIIDF